LYQGSLLQLAKIHSYRGRFAAHRRCSLVSGHGFNRAVRARRL